MAIETRKPQLIVFILLALCSVLLTSCAGSPTADSPEVDTSFSTISIISTEDVVKAATSDTESERSTEGAIVGGVSGATTGALIGAAMCAPTVYLAPLCATIYGIYGALAGATVGVTGGAYLEVSQKIYTTDTNGLITEYLKN